MRIEIPKEKRLVHEMLMPIRWGDMDESELLQLLDEKYTRHPFFGSRRMTKYLVEQGYPVNRNFADVDHFFSHGLCKQKVLLKSARSFCKMLITVA